MLRRLIGIVLAMTMVAVISHGQAWAVTTGTADGTYDFGSLGANDSAGTGWATLGDKFKVGNKLFIEWPSLNTGPYTAINPNSGSTTQPYTAVIKAEGGVTCKTFTFRDLGVSAELELQRFVSFDIVLRDINGAQIGSTISLGSSPVYPATRVTNLSELYSLGQWSVDNVAAIEISYIITANGIPEARWFLNLETITIANVSAPPSAPAVTGINPSGGPFTGGTPVTVTGADFAGTTAVTFGGLNASSYTVDLPTRITAISPAGSAGTVDIRVTTSYGTSATSAADQFRYMTFPTVTGISPSIGPLEGGTSVTITGTDFTGATAVTFGGSSAASYTVVSPTQITATSPAGSAGPVNVTITTPLGTSVASTADQFVYTTAPVVISISPSFGATGGGTPVTINGFNFTGVSAVNFGSINAAGYTVISPTQIVAVSPAGSAGTVDISVTTTVSTSAVSVADVFTFNNATGTADGIYDFGNLGLNDSAGIDSAGNGYARLGDKFKVGNDKYIQYQNVNTGPMTAIYPRSSTTLPYTAVIKAEGGTTCKTFTFKDLGISASNGFQKFDSLDIVLKDINGDQIGSAISLGSSPVYSTTSVTNISTLYLLTPWSVDGVAAIEITYAISENGISAFASDLNLENITIANVKGAPAITGLSVLNGQTIGGDTVVITGSNFSGASAVNFGSTSAAGFTIDSPTRIIATSPAVSTDMTVDITVATPLGISDASAADQFTYHKTNQSIFFGPAPTLIVGGTGTVAATATSGLTLAFNSATPEVCTVIGNAVTGGAVGTCSITADQPGNSLYNSAPQVTLNFSVGKGNQTISFGTAPVVIVGGTGTVSATATSGLTPSFDTTTPAVCTISGTTVTGVTAGTCVIAATQSGNAAYNTAPQVTQSLNVGKADQVISFSTAPAVVVGGTGTVSAIATPSGLAPTVISTTPDVCTISGATVTGVSAGTCTIAANQSGDNNYKAALQVTQSFSVGKTNQTISFGTAPVVIFGGTATVSATVNSGLAPIFSSTTPAVCTVSGTTVTGVAAGTCIIAADQGGNSNYNAAPQVTQSFSVGKAAQAISFGPAPTLIVGGTVTVSATATSGLTPTFSTTTPTICTISGTTVTGVTAGTCIIAANQAGDSNYNAAPQVTQDFSKASQIISFGAVPTVSVGGTGTVSATATSGLIPSISSLTAAFCSINGTTVTGVSAGTCVVAANQLGSNTYNSAPQVTQSFSVGKADQAISFGPAPTLIVGGNGTVSATTTSGLAPTFSSTTPAVCSVSGTTVTGVTAGTCIIAAVQGGNSNYNAALQVTQNISVGKATQTISFGTAPAVIFGGTGTVSATASSGLTPLFSSMTPAVCTISGTTVTGAAVGTCTIAADQSGASNYSAAPQVSQSFSVGRADQAISFGPAPTLIAGGNGTVSATTTSGLAPTFSSMTPAVCTISGTTVAGVTAGTCTISAKQVGDSSYNAALQVTQNISVGKATQTISFGPAPSVIFGGTGTVSATASSGLTPIFSSMTPAVCTISGTTVTGAAVGTCTIAADQSGTSNYSAAPQVSQSFSVGKADQAISFGPAPTLIVGGNGTVSATTTSGLVPTFSSLSTEVCTITGTTVTGITAGSCIIAADQPGNINYNAAPQVTQNFSKANQVIYFGPAPTVIVGVTGTVSATATSGLPPTFRSLTPAVCTASGTSITGVTAGTCIIAANQGGDGAYNAASQVSQSFGVGKGNQIISFGAAPTIIAGGTGVVSATAASGLSPTFSSMTPDVCTVSGTSVTGITAGTCIIAAKQIGNSSYDAAPQVTQAFSVGKGSQTISFGTIPFVIVGGTGSVSAISTSGLAPIFSSSTPFVCRVSGTTVTGISAGTCTITADQNGDAAYNPASQVLQSFSVGKGNQTISFGTIAVIVVGGTGTVSATATSGLPTAFTSMTPAVCTVTGSTVTGVTAGTCTIAANQNGDSNYNAALEAIQSISVVFSITLPQITLSTLDDGAFSSVDTINITGAVTALNGLRKLTINDAYITVNSSGTFSSLLTLMPGINKITVVATDNNDLTGTVIRTITLDATAPLITLAGGLTDNSITSFSQVTIRGGVDSDTTTVKISINGGTPEPAVMVGTGFSLPVTLSSGLNTIVIIAIDATGKTSSSKQSIVYNDAISLAVTAPAQDLKSGKREFTLTGLVSGAEPLTVIVEMDGQSFTQTVSNGSFSQPLTFTAEKNYPIHVTANDGNGSSVSITRNITYTWPDAANGGGIMSLSDVLNAFHIALGLKAPTSTDFIRCDVAPLDINGKPKGNNSIDIGDVVLMLRNLVGLVTWQ